MKSATATMPVGRTGRRASPALGIMLLVYVASGATAQALQVLEASDHAELTAEISDSEVNRIALDGDRVSRVIQSPGGYTVEHDPVRGELYLYPGAAAAFAPAPGSEAASGGASAPLTLYLGTEKGFTYRLTLSAEARASAQILIRNPAVTHAYDAAPAGDDYRAELVSLIVGVARGEPVAGYVVVPALEPTKNPERGTLLAHWRGSRFTAHLLSVPAGQAADAARLAKLSAGNVLAAWLSPPKPGRDGERTAVLVESTHRAEPAP